MRRTITRAVAILAGSLVAVSLSGCAGSTESPTQTQAGDELAEPTFTGPFAAEYTEAWRGTDSEFLRTIIVDEEITDQEWSEVLKTLSTCLADQGITMGDYNDDGSYEADTGGQEAESVNESMGDCEKQSGEGPVGWLYRAQTSNPDNVPESELLTDCLIRNGAVPSSYTVEEYLVDAPEFDFPFVDEHGYETFEKCNADPGLVP